ncbi:MAG: co-chaperone GroES [Candidatus Gracilibacteria bacterium]|nr:co-chaperone GroES [bacterium]MDZ4217012.1 co-chaperone GroES [Candidatus Gracilibacteria bacterium]
MSKLIPLDGRVVLKGIEAEETTKSGIIIPGAKEEKPKVFEVICVSEGRRMDDNTLRPHLIKKGQKVVCSQYAGDDIEIDNVTYKIISEDSVTAVIQD